MLISFCVMNSSYNLSVFLPSSLHFLTCGYLLLVRSSVYTFQSSFIVKNSFYTKEIKSLWACIISASFGANL